MTQNVEVLLVEDHPKDVELTLNALRQGKVRPQVQVVRDGEEALEFLFCRGEFSERSFDNPPRLVVLDLKLPKITGLEVLRTIKTDDRTRKIPVVILTSSNEDRDLVNGYELGVNSYVQKPVEFLEFSDRVKQLGLYWLVANQAPPTGPISE